MLISSTISRAGQQDGFTLVEMIIALILTTIAIGVFSQAFMDTFDGTNRAQATQTATSDAMTTIDRLGNDLRSSMSPDRDTMNLPNNDSLRNYVLRGIVPGTNDFRDIVQATQHSLWFRTDAIAERAGTLPETECVGYFLDVKKRLVRAVYANWRVCPGVGTPVNQTVLMLPPRPLPATIPGIFSFSTRYNVRGWQDPISLTDCTTQAETAAPTPAALNYITMVRVDLRAYGGRRDGDGESRLQGALDLRTRLAHNYQYALGCSY